MILGCRFGWKYFQSGWNHGQALGVKVCATPVCSRRIWLVSQVTYSVSTVIRAT